MTDATNVIAFRPRLANATLRRPRSLIRAAREGQSGWRRDRDLPRLLRCDHCPRPGAALARLRAEEELLNTARLEKAATYDLQRHVLLMIAILAEMCAAVETAPVARPTALAGVMTAAMDRLTARGTAIQAHL